MPRRPAVVLLVVVAGLALALLLAQVAGIGVRQVNSDSMAPGYGTGTRLMTVTAGAEVQRDAVVVFTTPESWRELFAAQSDDGAPQEMVKRVIGVGGDRIECCAADGNLVRNGERLVEPWLATAPGEANSATYRITVPDGHLWLMGDNRTVSFDSRSLRNSADRGFVPTSAVRGRVVAAW